MKTNEVKYMRRWNLGNYEHDEVTVSAAPSEGETILGTLLTIEKEIKRFKNGEVESVQVSLPIPPVTNVTTVTHAEKQVEETPVEKKERKARATKAEMEARAGVKDEVKAEEKVESPKQEEKVEATKEEAKVEVKEEKKEEKKSLKSKVEVYDRTNEDHKKSVSMYLDAAYAGWRDNVTLKTKVAAMSRDAVGKDFFDINSGEVVQSFKDFVTKSLS